MISEQALKDQLQFCLDATDFPSMGEKYEGKVRDCYIKDGKRVIVVTDRLSAFDRVLSLIPFKGQILNQMAQFWFEQTKDIVANHVIESPDPNVCVGKECKSLPVEMVVRGYLTGSSSTSIWTCYDRGDREYCGLKLEDGMKKDQKFETPLITPTTKAAKGEHDELISREEIIEQGLLTAEQFDHLAEVSLKLFQRGTEIAAKQGIILVDTKYEFGIDSEGNIVVIDEIHTPDSSRFWYADSYEEAFTKGEEQKKIDKEYLRVWLANQGYRGDGEPPVIPDEIRLETAKRYIEAFGLITGTEFKAEVGDPLQRIEANLADYL